MFPFNSIFAIVVGSPSFVENNDLNAHISNRRLS